MFKILIIALTLFTFNAKAEDDFSLYPEPFKAPVSLFEDSKGNLKTLGNYQNKVTILNFWATWCKPCLVEMPALNALQKSLNGVAVVPIASVRDEVSKIRALYRRYKLKELDYFIDNDSFTAGSYDVKNIPTSFVFNKQGELVAYVSGSIDWMAEDNYKFIKNLVEE